MNRSGPRPRRDSCSKADLIVAASTYLASIVRPGLAVASHSRIRLNPWSSAARADSPLAPQGWQSVRWPTRGVGRACVTRSDAPGSLGAGLRVGVGWLEQPAARATA